MRWLALATALWALPAHAARYAVVVGNNSGLGPEAPLRYAESDAARVDQVLRELGGFAQVQRLDTPSLAAVQQALDAAAAHIAAAHDSEALLLFFYSGHADGSSLHLSDGALPLDELRKRLADSGAAVRVGVLDACGTGAITERAKGLSREPPFLLSAPPELAARGQVILAAVSASEAAQESDALQGSFFSTFLVAGLRGAADAQGTGRVTLDEAYRYAYAQTVRATLLSRAGAQHPSYDVDLSGEGDLVLTEPRRGRARLAFKADEPGEFAVFTPAAQMVAEITLDAGSEALLALEPGDYEVHKRTGSGLRYARIALGDGQDRELREARMEKLDYVPLARKGLAPAGFVSLGPGLGQLPGVQTALDASTSAAPTVRAGLQLLGETWAIEPRITFGQASAHSVAFDGPAASPQPVGTVAVSQWFGAAGAAVERVWERGRFELRAGPAADAILIHQDVFGTRSHALGALAGVDASAGARLAGSAVLFVSAEGGAELVRANAGLSVRPEGLIHGGVHFDL